MARPSERTTAEAAAMEAALHHLAEQDEAMLRSSMALLLAAYGLKLGKTAAKYLLTQMIEGLQIVPDDGAGVA